MSISNRQSVVNLVRNVYHLFDIKNLRKIWQNRANIALTINKVKHSLIQINNLVGYSVSVIGGILSILLFFGIDCSTCLMFVTGFKSMIFSNVSLYICTIYSWGYWAYTWLSINLAIIGSVNSIISTLFVLYSLKKK